MKYITLLFIGLLGTCLVGLSQETDPKFGKIKVRKYEEQQFYVELDNVPKYVNGPDALLNDIQKGIIYPKEAASNNIDGTVMVNVIIDKHGRVINTSIDSSPNPILNNAAMTAVKGLEKFEPYLLNGILVPSQFILPIKFILPL